MMTSDGRSHLPDGLFLKVIKRRTGLDFAPQLVVLEESTFEMSFADQPLDLRRTELESPVQVPTPQYDIMIENA